MFTCSDPERSSTALSFAALLALVCAPLTAACGAPADDIHDDDTVRVTDLHDDTPTGFLGFSPDEVVTATPITLELGARDACGADCFVTIDGVDAPFVDDTHAAVLLPRTARTGEVCVTMQGETTCKDGLTVLDTARVEDVVVQKVAAGTSLTVHGAGFPIDAIVVLGFERLETTFVSPFVVQAAVPSAFVAGTYALSVLAPSHGRCGTPSPAVEVALTP